MKFIFWPLSILSIIFVDKTFLLFLNDDLYKVMFLFSIVPLAGNTVTLAILLGIKPQKASLAILFSTIFSLFFIPFAMVLYGGFS
jgi:predicted permease